MASSLSFWHPWRSWREADEGIDAQLSITNPAVLFSHNKEQRRGEKEIQRFPDSLTLGHWFCTFFLLRSHASKPTPHPSAMSLQRKKKKHYRDLRGIQGCMKVLVLISSAWSAGHLMFCSLFLLADSRSTQLRFLHTPSRFPSIRDVHLCNMGLKMITSTVKTGLPAQVSKLHTAAVDISISNRGIKKWKIGLSSIESRCKVFLVASGRST